MRQLSHTERAKHYYVGYCYNDPDHSPFLFQMRSEDADTPHPGFVPCICGQEHVPVFRLGDGVITILKGRLVHGTIEGISVAQEGSLSLDEDDLHYLSRIGNAEFGRQLVGYPSVEILFKDPMGVNHWIPLVNIGRE